MELQRGLGVRDLTLFAIACIVGTRWIASAAHAGPGSLLLWVLAAIFFLVPLAIAVAALTARNPEAGGLYRWTRADFGPWHAFLAFWVYWTSIAVWFPSAAMFYVSIVLPSAGRVQLVLIALAAIWIALGTNIIGLNIGKWTENAGALAAWLLAVVLVVAAVLIFRHHGSATEFHIKPDLSWDTVNFWSTIAYAMSGFEMAGLMGGEIRNPARDIPRAAWISTIFVVLFYVASTAALLVLLRPADISELTGLIQAGATAAQALSAPWLPPLIMTLVMLTALGQFGGLGTSVSRMPFAAGVDHLLPPAFASVHPRWKTPHVSMLVFGALASVLLVIFQFGDTMRAAYQALVSLMVIGGFLPYLYLFASAWKAGKRWSAVSGIAVTLIAVLCSVVPTADVHDVMIFEGKLLAGTVAMVVSARLIYSFNSAAKR